MCIPTLLCEGTCFPTDTLKKCIAILLIFIYLTLIYMRDEKVILESYGFHLLTEIPHLFSLEILNTLTSYFTFTL